MENVAEYGKMIKNHIMEYSPKVITAIVLLFAGLWLIRFISRTARKIMVKRDVELTLQMFLASLINWTLKIMLFIMVVMQLGIPATSFITILGAAGLAVGLALQGSLSNFAGGVLLLLFKPFKIGDFIDAKGIKGTVKEIGIFSTKLTTFGNEVAIIPNGPLYNDNIINFSAEETRRDNIIAGISYDSDIKLAKSILLEITSDNENILKDPVPQVFVAELADSSVNLSLRYWTKSADFWDCHFYVIEQIKYRFDANGIEIPFPHQVEIQKQK